MNFRRVRFTLCQKRSVSYIFLLFTNCSWLAPEFFITSSWLWLFTARLWLVHDCFTSPTFRELILIYKILKAWLVLDFFTTCLWLCSWLVHNLLLVHNFFMSCSLLVHNLFMTCSWLVHGLLMTSSWLFHYLLPSSA